MSYTNPSQSRLIDALDAAVQQQATADICAVVKRALIDTITDGDFELPAEFVRSDES